MKLFEQADKIVIKVGSFFITDPKTTLAKQEWLDSLVDDAVNLIKKGKKLVIVSSGAIVLGCNTLKLNPAKLKLQEKQNAAVCGQHAMMNLYEKSFARHGINVAQALITIEDVENRKRFVSIKNTINYLLDNNIVPIINENDLIANTEIRFGDNDRLSARVTQIVNADLLVMLSLVDGLFTADPQIERNVDFISEIYAITPDIEKMASDSEEKTGGMSAKIVAAKIALHSNCNVIIANGNFNHPIKRILEGNRCSSFIANSENVTKKYKIG
jgi:glutamate 5-kinase